MKSLIPIIFLGWWPTGPSPDLDALPLNRLQVIGSHNSYKQAIDPTLFQLLKRQDSTGRPSRFDGIDYSHIPLADQLSRGLLNLEIDVYADAQGGKYAHPKGLDWAGKTPDTRPYDSTGVMNEPGFKVLHIPEIDFRSHCLTFRACLRELKTWSDRHPGHYPIFVTLNAKDDVINRPGFTVPEKFTPAVFDQLDRTILDNLGRAKLIRPDDVRGTHKTLEGAVLAGGWPTVGAVRGKFMFILDETAPKRAAYAEGHPSLTNRVLFTNADAGQPEAAVLILNDPIRDEATIRARVSQGYLVRTRADADTKQARLNDKRPFEAACRSGAQIISTDYYAKSTHFSSDYVVHFEDGTYVRANPVVR